MMVVVLLKIGEGKKYCNRPTVQPPVKIHQPTLKFLESQSKKDFEEQVLEPQQPIKAAVRNWSPYLGAGVASLGFLLGRRHGVPSQSHLGRRALDEGGRKTTAALP
jgi:hypothetical protein